jgi:hypothetical protein
MPGQSGKSRLTALLQFKHDLQHDSSSEERGGKPGRDEWSSVVLLPADDEEAGQVSDGEKVNLYVGRTPWQQLRLAGTAVLVMALLGLGLTMRMGDLGWTWSIDETGATAGGDGVLWVTERLTDGVRADPEDARAQQQWARSVVGEDEEEEEDSTALRWRRQHARTAYLRTLV